MRGGRILGQGTYGCVFQPTLACRGDSAKQNDNMVGKITSKIDARNELEIARILNKIQDSSKYTIPVKVDACTPRSKSKQTDKDIDMCVMSRETQLENTIQLLMPWGGYPLSNVNLDPRVFDFFKFTEEILAIGAFLVLNGLCHFDIWGQNFLFDKQNHPKLIDFGFAFKADNIDMNTLYSRWRMMAVDHDTETPEVTLMLSSNDNIPNETIILGLQREKPAVQRLAVLCGVDPMMWSNELRLWTTDSQGFQHRDWLRCWKTYWPGFDAWSIGAVLLMVLEIQMSIPGFAESPMWKTKGDLIKNVLKGLCRSSPVYRLDAAEALNILSAGAHPLISSGSAGSEWIREKEARRS
jgi:serine/threonine protein kinase